MNAAPAGSEDAGLVLSAEERIVEVLRGHLWNDHPGRTCGCGWLATSEWMLDPTMPNRVEQWLAHVAARIARTPPPAGDDERGGAK